MERGTGRRRVLQNEPGPAAGFGDNGCITECAHFGRASNACQYSVVKEQQAGALDDEDTCCNGRPVRANPVSSSASVKDGLKQTANHQKTLTSRRRGDSFLICRIPPPMNRAASI